MNLSFLQFEVLVRIERHPERKHSQRTLAKELDCSLGMVNKIFGELIDLELICNKEKSLYDVTLKGYRWLEPYRVKKAIFIAAGFGSRLVPITLNTPKPLIRIKGKCIIETLLDAVLEAGINDITIVRGYLGEQFDVLLRKYPMIKFWENPLFNETNNISSAYVVKDQFENSYIFDSDLIVYSSEVIRRYEYCSNYLGRYIETTDDWCFETKNDVITKMRTGGKNVFHMYGLSYWTKVDGERLSKDIELVYNSPGGKEKFWDEVALSECGENYRLIVRKCKEGDVIEIDTFNELKKIDPIYAM